MRDQAKKNGKRMVVIDDDPVFLNIMAAAAKYAGIEHESFGSLDEMGTFTRLGDYDIAVLDYSLPAMTGVEIAEYIDIFFDRLPVILVSGSKGVLQAENDLPDCIREFKPKDDGIYGIIKAAKAILDQKEFAVQ